MTTQRWNKICDRWLAIVLIPLIVAAIHHEVGSWREALVVVIVIVCGGIVGTFIIATIAVACSEDIQDWLKRH